MDEITASIQTKSKIWDTLKTVSLILTTLFLFFFAIEMMIVSLQHLGTNALESVSAALQNPFTGLFAGLLVTSVVQSSSATTSLAVAMVASGSLSLQSALPVIMGANVGTTITSSVISLGFVNRKKELKRAVAAGSYHYFFNLLTLLIIFPLELRYGLLSSASSFLASFVFQEPAMQEATATTFYTDSTFRVVIKPLLEMVGNAYVLILFAFVLLIASIFIFRKLISDLLKARSPESFSRFFFRSELKSFFWGALTTAAIRSSTITTSVVVPMVAKKITSLRQAVPFILGANVGTTITAFIAAIINANSVEAGGIAIAHFLFNVSGVLLFLPVAVLKKVPITLARWLGDVTQKYRFAALVFILITFFFLPFVMLYFSQR